MDGIQQGEQARMHEFLRAVAGGNASNSRAPGDSAAGNGTAMAGAAPHRADPINALGSEGEPTVHNMRVVNPLTGSKDAVPVPADPPLTAETIRNAVANHFNLRNARDVEIVVAGRRLEDDVAAATAAVCQGAEVRALPVIAAGQHSNEADAFRSMLKHMGVDAKALKQLNICSLSDMKDAIKGLGGPRGIDLDLTNTKSTEQLRDLMRQLEKVGGDIQLSLSTKHKNKPGTSAMLNPAMLSALLSTVPCQKDEERAKIEEGNATEAMLKSLIKQAAALGKTDKDSTSKAQEQPTRVELKKAQCAFIDELAAQHKATERRKADNRSTARKLEELRAKMRVAKKRRERKRQARERRQHKNYSSTALKEAAASDPLPEANMACQRDNTGFAGMRKGFLPAGLANKTNRKSRASSNTSQFGGFKVGFLF